MASALLDAARGYVSLGWPVFPCRVEPDPERPGKRSKRPTVAWAEFQHRVPTALEIEDWWAEPRRTTNGIGVATGILMGAVVVDVDDPSETARDHALAYFGETHRIARTVSGGWHLYYRHPGRGLRIPNTVRIPEFTEPVDLRGDGGFVVLPPTDGYAWVEEGEMGVFPAERCLRQAALAPEDPPEESTPAPSSDALVSRVRLGAAQGQRHAELLRLVGGLVARGERQEVVLELAHAFARNCQPPITDRREIEEAVRDVVRADPARGRVRQERAAEERPRDPEQVQHPIGLTGDRLLELLARPIPPPIAPGIIYPHTASLLIGEPFIGKSHLFAWLGSQLAIGLAAWDGAPEPERPLRIAFVTREDQVEMLARRMITMDVTSGGRRARGAWKDHLYFIGFDPWIDPALVLQADLSEKGTDFILRDLDAAGPFDGVFLDTVPRMFPREFDENDAVDSGIVWGRIERLRQEIGGFVVGATHPPKSIATNPDLPLWARARGSSALVGAARAICSLESHPGGSHLRRLRAQANLPGAPKSLSFAVGVEEHPEEMLWWRPTSDTRPDVRATSLLPDRWINTSALAALLARQADRDTPNSKDRDRAASLRSLWEIDGQIETRKGSHGAIEMRPNPTYEEPPF